MAYTEDENFSRDPIYNGMLNGFYKIFFNGLTPHVNVKRIETVRNYKLQKAGIDKIIHLSNGSRINIDEKIRRRHYTDILLEVNSRDTDDYKSDGWITGDNKLTDFIIYVNRNISVIDYAELRPWFLENLDRLKMKYGVKVSKDTTTNIPVPLSELRDANLIYTDDVVYFDVPLVSQRHEEVRSSRSIFFN